MTPAPNALPPRRPGHRAPASPAPSHAIDARTLYLVPADTLAVSSTGEALVVSRPDGDLRRLPIARLLRVVCNERVHWSGAALGLCQIRGITVTWIDSRGDVLGSLWPAQGPQSDLSDTLEALTGLPCDWPQLYSNWLRRQRLSVLTSWQNQRAKAGKPVDAEEWNRAKHSWVYRNELPQHLPPMLHGMVCALVASRLAADGLTPDYWCVDGSRIALAADLARLIWAELNLTGGAFVQALRDQRETAALFEQWSTLCADLLQMHLASLKAHAMRAGRN